MEKFIIDGYIHYKLEDIIKDDFLTESTGTFQLERYKDILQINNNLKLFVDKVFDDIEHYKYKDHKIQNKDFINEYLNSGDNAYILTYNTPFNWLDILHVYIVENNNLNIKGLSLIDNDKFSIFGKDKVLHTGVIIYNPENNTHICNTLYHELKHTYRQCQLYKSNLKYDEQYNDIRISNSTHHNFNYDISSYNKIIHNLKLIGINQYVELRNFIYEALYYLNSDELCARLEDVFCEFKKILSSNSYSFKDTCELSGTYQIYNSIKVINNYCLENKVILDEAYKKNIGSEKFNNILKQDINKFKKAFNDKQHHNNYNFIYKKFNSKLKYFDKHIEKMYEFLRND